MRVGELNSGVAFAQIYADWWYAWCLTYFWGTHKDVYIVLKKSLKWLPIVGWVSFVSVFYSSLCANESITGYAILQLHIPQPFVGIRPYSSRQVTLMARPPR